MKNTIYPNLKFSVIIPISLICFLISGPVFSQKNTSFERNSKGVKIEKAERSPNYELYNKWKLDTLYSIRKR